jgi:hypothetical protein
MTKLKTNKTFIKQKPRIKNEIKMLKVERMIEKKKRNNYR